MKNTLILISLLFSPFSFASTASWHFSAKDVTALHSEPADAQIAYGKDPMQFGEFRLPKGKGPFPAIIVIHGGCWLSKFADFKNTSPLADALRKQGYATWNIEYRSEDVTGGGYPGTFLDVANATDYLTILAKQYPLDLNHVIVIGHSAGGHLALWDAARVNILKSSALYIANPLKLSGAISLAGVPDLKAFQEQGIKVCGEDVVSKLLTADDASPINLLPARIPEVLLYGEDDQVVPAKLGEGYILKAKQNVKLLTIKDAAHHEYNVPNSVVWPVLLDMLKRSESP